MHALIENSSGGTEDSTEVAREAVKQFRAMMPMLNAYVRMMTGKSNARVIMTTDSPRTDGKDVYLRPPTDLGRKATHKRLLCDKRDAETWLQRCPACAQRESVLVNLFHEIAHIVYESMVPATESEKIKFLKQAAKVGNSEAIQKRLAQLSVPDQFKWLGLARAVSPYFQLLLNALEDVRVNQRMFQARKGVYPMYIADEMRILREGIERIDPDTGELVRRQYHETPLDSQAIIGVYLLGMDIFEDEYLDPMVSIAMHDRELRFLAEDIRTVKSAQGAVNLAFKVLVRLRELGFLLEPDERPESEPENDDEDHESEGSDNPEQGDEGNNAQGDSQETGEGDGPGAGLPEDDDSSESNQSPDEGNSGGSPSPASDGSGSDAAPPGEHDSPNEGDGSAPDDAAPGDSDGDSAGGCGDRGEDGRRDSEMDGDRSRDPQDGGDVSPEGVGDEDAGAGRGADRTIEEGNDADDDGELDDLDRSDGHEGSDKPDADSDGPGPDTDGDPTPAPGNGDTDGAESSPVGDDDGPQEAGDGREAADGQGSSQAQAAQQSRPEYGTAEDAQEVLEQVFGHLKNQHIEAPLSPAEQEQLDEAVSVAISQSEHFDAPAQNVGGILFAEYRDGWRKPGQPTLRIRRDEEDTIDHYMPPESALGPALLRMRRTFADNARGGYATNLKSGKINNRALGKRAWSGDDRLFRQRIAVKVKKYKVVIGLDVSGSTAGFEINLIKRAGMAQAELLHRLKIPFAVYAHTGGWRGGDDLWGGQGLLDAHIFTVKEFDQPWDNTAKQKLAELRSQSVNLDGHTIEFYRKRLDEVVTDKETEGILMYYTDGAMPLTNFDEELEVLQRELKTCQRLGYTEMAVGIGTDSPIEHGFDTVVLNGDEDLVKVVAHLERRLLR